MLGGLREADRVISNPTAQDLSHEVNPIRSLLGKDSQESARNEFVVMGHGIPPTCPSVPMAIFSSHDGSLNEVMDRRVDTGIGMMTMAGFDCRGIAYDGDRFLLGPAPGVSGKDIKHIAENFDRCCSILSDAYPMMTEAIFSICSTC
jgi:hypothetical protein